MLWAGLAFTVAVVVGWILSGVRVPDRLTGAPRFLWSVVALLLLVGVASTVMAVKGDGERLSAPETTAAALSEGGTAPCADRLTVESNPSDAEHWRVAPPTDLELTYRRSAELDGRLTAIVEWTSSDDRVQGGLLAISGRRGEAHQFDMGEILSVDAPPSGECGVWYRSYQRQTPQQTGWAEVVDGLWAGETYCFAVNSSDADGGNTGPFPSIMTDPICGEAEWRAGWGDPERP